MREKEAGDEANSMKVHAKGLILSHALTRVTAPSCRGSLLEEARKASPERGGARLRRAEGFVPRAA